MSATAETTGARRLAPVLCSEASAGRGEPLAATASRADHWILVEYGRLWNREVLAGSGLTDEVKGHLREQLDRLPRSRLLFLKRPDRRDAETVAVFFGASAEGRGRLFGLEVESYDALRDVDMAGALLGGRPAGVELDHPLLVVCTHGKRDRCCALHGRPLYEALAELPGSGTWAWQASHVGGDRFAGNLVALADGLYFGRVEPGDAAGIVEELSAGRIPLERYRGRASYGFPAQAGERRVREETGARGIADLLLVSAEAPRPGAWRLRFLLEPSGGEHEVEVAEQWADEPAWLTCGASRPQRARAYVATAYRAVS